MKKTMHTRSLTVLLLVLVTAAAVYAPADAQELASERLYLLPIALNFTRGIVRLDGMGGFEVSVADENNEINALDYAANPAWLSEDRDSWSLDVRYSHREYVDRGQAANADDIRLNDGGVFVGYHKPGSFGVAGSIDYGELDAQNRLQQTGNYKLAGFQIYGNRFFTRNFSVGLAFSYRSEEEGYLSPEIYDISHDGSVVRGGLGLVYRLMSGVVLGAKGQFTSTSLDGTSRSGFHTDTFDWSRPGVLLGAHAFVDRGRLQLGVDYTHDSLDGKETAKISWSERFAYNPANGPISADVRTFTEDRSTNTIRARFTLDLVPRTLALSAGGQWWSNDSQVLANPNVFASLSPLDASTDSGALAAGLSWTALQGRLLVAGEYKHASIEILDRTHEDELTQTPALTDRRTENLIRLGGEYLMGEVVVGRLGVKFGQNNLELDTNQELSGDYGSTVMAFGLGFVPQGGIWQFDIAYDLLVNSDLDLDGSQFSMYLKHLF